MNDRIMKKALEIQDELVYIRRDIHENPEKGFHETRTAKLVADKLQSLGIEVKTEVGKTGVIGLLKGKQPGKTILLRGDMDCLEMDELVDVPYKSKNKGLMHSCGHDAHTSWLLGAAMILSEMKDEIHGNVKFLFQPAEEIAAGAKLMVEEGALENPRVDAAIGAHIMPEVPSGMIGVGYNAMLAACGYFKIKIKGRGAGGASPHNSIDPISIGCQVHTGLQTIVSRRINPLDPAVISICQFNGGSAHNVIPEEMEMAGTVRSQSYELEESIPKMMEEIIAGITSASGADYEFEYETICPPVINNMEITSVVEVAGQKILGEENVITINRPGMGGEDFAFISKEVPSSFFAVGTFNKEKNIVVPAHNPYFDIDEDVLCKASAVISQAAIEYLSK